MMIVTSARFFLPPPATDVILTMDDGSEWQEDISRPADTEVRVSMHEWLSAGNEPQPYVPPILAQQFMPISFRQFCLALWKTGFLTAQEALALAKDRTIPPGIQAILDQLPDDDKFAAEITISAMQEAQRRDSLFSLLVSVNAATEEQIDGVFALAATL